MAKKFKPNGYYLPKTEEERNAGLAPYKRQILTEQKNLAAMMAVNLTEYWSQTKKPDGNQARNKTYNPIITQNGGDEHGYC